MTEVFKLNVGENVTVSAYDVLIAAIMADAMSVVKHYQQDLFRDALRIDAIKRECWGLNPKYVWSLRKNGTDLVTMDAWNGFDQLRKRAQVAFILTFGDYGINFERTK